RCAFCGIVPRPKGTSQMNQTPHPHAPNPRRLPDLPESLRRPPSVQAAKWPPDDDGMMPGSMGGASFSGGGGDDGNFKKGRFKPVAIILGVLFAGAAAGIFFFGGMKDAERLSAKEIADVKKETAI